MLSIYDKPSAADALALPLDPHLRTIITDRLRDARTLGLEEQTHLVVIQRGDSEASLLAELGWSPLVNPLSQLRYGEPGFVPYWSWLQDLGGWYELIHTVGDSGFAYVLLIQQSIGVQRELLSMCAEGARTCAS